MSDMSC